MKRSSCWHLEWPVLFTAALAVSMVAGAAFIIGCGAGSGTPPMNGITSVTVLSSSTANDKLFQFSATINTLTLTSQSGKTISLSDKPLYVEFTHLNGVAEPLATTTVPQDVYSSATASLGPSGFTCASLGPEGVLATSFFGYTDSTPDGNITVNLPAPVTITGANLVLSLHLLVSQSANYTGCYTKGGEPFSITPTFSLAPVSIATRPTNSANGKSTGLEGIVASVDGSANSFVVSSADGSNYGGADPSGSFDPANGPNWQIEFNGSTIFQGISGPSQLVAGLAVDMDATNQEDGSLLATRVAVYDTDSTNTSLWVIPALFEDNSVGSVMLTGEKEQLGPVLGGDGAPINFDTSTFYVSGQLTNITDLPFPATFSGTNIVAGQNIGVTFHQLNYGNSLTGPPATTITLLPQNHQRHGQCNLHRRRIYNLYRYARAV